MVKAVSNSESFRESPNASFEIYFITDSCSGLHFVCTMCRAVTLNSTHHSTQYATAGF